MGYLVEKLMEEELTISSANGYRDRFLMIISD